MVALRHLTECQKTHAACHLCGLQSLCIRASSLHLYMRQPQDLVSQLTTCRPHTTDGAVRVSGPTKLSMNRTSCATP